ncbi:MAG: N-6 DNA methylase, partial [Gammaproteobacteria bacterium]|nr:N-6 DNA methylase [Gammaproteobacteria bacterium]
MSPPAIRAYLKEAAAIQSGGEFTEHSFRGALQKLLQAHLPGVDITNEPGRIMEGGAPDYVLKRNQIPLGYIEAKNIDKSLDDKTFRDQFNRYLQSLDNLIFTNYLEFRFYRDAEIKPVAVIAIAELRGGKIKPLPENFARFENLIADFGAYQGQTITVADDLAKRMADKARLLAGVIEEALREPTEAAENRSLGAQLRTFQKYLISDINEKRFAGVYAQTIAYGLFVARLHDSLPGDFSRRKAAELIPSSNPFLGKFFGYIADYDLDARIRWIVDDLADIFRATDVDEVMRDFGRATGRTDPFLHFYETFLGKYDSRLRKGRGVYYTPEPAVNFIVRAVDSILKKEFGLKNGLADTAKTTAANGGKKRVHKVQILDPATGTGTFLADTIKHIYRGFRGQKGIWPDYVRADLIPRLNGFEILMAPYAMAHLKLEMVLRETGCELDGERLRILLTNSLEQHHPGSDTLFAQWLADESREANKVKRDAPLMVVFGNPPYSVSTHNTGAWIEGLMGDYKKDLRERNIQPLSDDYVKFIRYG